MSHYFLIQKKSSRERPILDLRNLNEFNQLQHFKMVTLSTIIPAPEWGTGSRSSASWRSTSISQNTLPTGCSSNSSWDPTIINTRYYPLAFVQGIFQGPWSGGGASMQTRDYNIPIPGQLPPQSSIRGWCVQSHKKNDGPFLEPQPPDKHTKIGTDANIAAGIYWGPAGCYIGQKRIRTVHKFRSHISGCHYRIPPQDRRSFYIYSPTNKKIP